MGEKNLHRPEGKRVRITQNGWLETSTSFIHLRLLEFTVMNIWQNAGFLY